MTMVRDTDIPTDFFGLLRHPKYCLVFEDWLRSDHSFENLQFWKEVEAYKELPPDQLAAGAAAIQARYFELGSEYEINLDHHQKIHLKERSSNPTPDLYDEIQISIFLLMRLDSYPKFLESDQFRAAQGLPPKTTSVELEDDEDTDEPSAPKPKAKFACLR